MDATQPLKLWYKQPASRWIDALPLGNGRLGAMVFGQTQDDTWQLNEDSVWYGGAQDRHPPDAFKYLPQLRNLLSSGRLQEAEDLAEKAFFATPSSQRHYEPLGTLMVRTDHAADRVSNYERSLDINTATCCVSYEVDGVHYLRSVLASAPHDVIVGRWEASHQGKISWDLRVSRGDGPCLYVDSIESLSPSGLVMTAKTGGDGVGVCLMVNVRVDQGE